MFCIEFLTIPVEVYLNHFLYISVFLKWRKFFWKLIIVKKEDLSINWFAKLGGLRMNEVRINDSAQLWTRCMIHVDYTSEERQTLRAHLCHREVKEILSDSRMFWLFFCNTFKSNPCTNTSWRCQDVKIWSPCSDPKQYTASLMQIVELMRRHLFIQFEKKEPALFALRKRNNVIFKGINQPFIQFVPVVRADQNSTEPKDSDFWIQTDLAGWKSNMYPVLRNMMDELGASWGESQVALYLGSKEGPSLSRCYQSGDSLDGYEIDFLGEEEPLSPEYRFFLSQEFTDVKFIFSGGREVKAHALVVVRFSEMIEKMLTTNMQEASSRSVTMGQYSYATGKTLLKWCYIGGAALSNETDFLELFQMAHFCQMEPLMRECLRQIETQKEKLDPAVISTFIREYQREYPELLTWQASPVAAPSL